MNALGNSHLFLTCSGGGGGVILVCFPQQLAWQFFALWYGSYPILQEENCWGSFSSLLHFCTLLYIFYFTIIIICNCLPGCPSLIVAQPGGGDGFLFRPLRIPFLSVVRLWSPFATASGSVALAVAHYYLRQRS